jgi:rod shape-determining protein MreD
MAGYLSIPVLAVVVILQATLMPELSIAGGTPDLVLLVVLGWSLMAGYEQGLLWAVVGGILQDLISAVPVGTTSLALVLVVSLAALIVGQVHPRNLVYPPLVAAAATLVVHLVTEFVLVVTGRPLPFLGLLLSVTLPSMVYNLVVMVPVYRILGTFYLAGRPRRVEGL